jgi:hypothetical protein
MAFQRASTVRSFLARRRPSTWRRPVRLGSNRHCRGEEHQAGADCFDLLLNISNECIAVDWAVEQAGRGQAVASKRADKGRGLPAAVWNHIDHALVAGPPSCSRVMFPLVQVSSTRRVGSGSGWLVPHATPLALWRRQHGPVRPLGATFFNLRSSVFKGRPHQTVARRDLVDRAQPRPQLRNDVPQLPLSLGCMRQRCGRAAVPPVSRRLLSTFET